MISLSTNNSETLDGLYSVRFAHWIDSLRSLCLGSALGLWLIVTWASIQATAQPAYTDRIAAIVNKEVITLSELNAALEDEYKRLRARFSGEDLARRLRQKRYEILNGLIERTLQLQEARARGLTVSDEEIQRAMKRTGLAMPESANANEQIRKRIEEQVLLEKLRAFEVQRLVTVSDAEVVRYYHEHQEEFMSPPTYRLKQILWLVDPGQNDQRIVEKAEEVYRALQNGAAFEALARDYSEGPEAVHGGNLGIVREDELLAPLARVLKTMKPGDISPPIRTSLGVHILGLEERIPGNPIPLDQVEQAIKTHLYQERAQATYQQWLTELRQKAFIDIKLVESEHS